MFHFVKLQMKMLHEILAGRDWAFGANEILRSSQSSVDLSTSTRRSRSCTSTASDQQGGFIDSSSFPMDGACLEGLTTSKPLASGLDRFEENESIEAFSAENAPFSSRCELFFVDVGER